MSVHEKLDKTRKNIGSTGLGEKEKKDLFNKFVDAGGKVINENTRRAMADFDRDRQKQAKAKIESHRERIQSSAPVQRKTQPAAPKPRIQKTASPGSFMSIWYRWKIRFKLYFMGVTDFYGISFKAAFLDRVNSDYKSALIEIQLVYLDVFKKTPVSGRAIIDELDNSNPIYVELMDMAASVFDRTLMNQIVETHEAFPDVAQMVGEFRTPLIALFKKLYVLYSYQDFITYSFEKSINLQMKLEKKKSGEYTAKKKKVNNALSLVYSRFFNALYWLMCNYAGTVLPLMEPGLDRFLDVTDQDRPGKRKKRVLVQAAEEKQEQESRENEAEDKKPEIPEAVKSGLQIMSRLDLGHMQEFYEVERHFKVIYNNDKVLTVFLLFREFDEEYSFILTTNKIKYNIIFSQEGKIDFRLRLSDLYNGLRKCMSLFKDYADVMETYEKMRTERPTSNAQYIDYSKKLQDLEKKRSISGKNLRGIISSFMDKCSEELKVLIDDLNGPQKIIENPQEELLFEQSIEGLKKVHGRKVYEAVYAAYSYASAFVFRLSNDGDLSGELDFKEGEGPRITKEESPEDHTPGVKSAPEDEKKKSGIDSVIRELDDLL